MSSKVLLRKAKTAALPKQAKASKSKPLPDESSEDSFDEDDLLDSDEQPDDDDSGEDDDGDESSEEEPDVTEEALQRMMELLGEEDPEALAALQAEDSDAEEQDETMGEVEDEDSPDEELYEDLDEVDGDVVPVERTTVNDQDALRRVLATFKTETTFFETLTLSYPKPLEIPDAENDLDRELEFYKQALWAAQHAEGLFQAEGLPFTRPADYFAEMLKTDDHMSRIRQSLLDEQAGFKASDDARKLRDAKKFGKKVQVERLKEREKEKKEVGKRLEGLKKKRKGADGGFATTEDFDVALEDAISGTAAKRPRTSFPSERGGRGGARGGISRRGRDAKFGNPTSSRRPKENNAKFDKEDGGGRPSRGGARGGRGGRGGSSRGGSSRGGAGGGEKKRLGKSRRN